MRFICSDSPIFSKSILLTPYKIFIYYTIIFYVSQNKFVEKKTKKFLKILDKQFFLLYYTTEKVVKHKKQLEI